jgi:hypothetical protein
MELSQLQTILVIIFLTTFLTIAIITVSSNLTESTKNIYHTTQNNVTFTGGYATLTHPYCTSIDAVVVPE